jgi:DNA-binding transcriptional MerR regulator
MTYTIKEVSELFDLSIYTLRYYDKQGLLPFVSKNASGYREFTESDLGFIYTICCLKNTGMPLKDIRTYIDYCMQGVSTIDSRRSLLEAHRRNVLEEIAVLQSNLTEVDKKITDYSSPDAEQVIAEKIRKTRLEKEKYRLNNPFSLDSN